MGVLDDKYFKWLIAFVGFKPKDDGVCRVLWQLHNIDFFYSIPNDANRKSDGLKLRESYRIIFGTKAAMEECLINDAPVGDGSEEGYVRPCSVLEVLIGFSKRIADEVLGDGSDDEAGLRRWIYIFLRNLGIIDSNANVIRSKGEICTIVERWLRRDFDEYGNYSPFPIRVKTIDGIRYYTGFGGRNVPFEDQRGLEIWKQFCIYLSEHPELE